ncbi:class III extradiol ring-cleavage dioxygenase family protein [Cellulomonas rhizosphaerae]|uniref:Extradiol ring-cleavage dioxygenase class III enzyme subunit B domain-containing protein n=1 Tax=Cellulomonas rhizosphaerae TaxID=2293719 RepID=A0A413RP59_9CELL|nr:hypothetical protein [Cellulomonas rhizosphaerae]RHA43806.1 hypothetical protein D1825_04470 [Cellulomonas rhizosphaerae]
MLTAAALVPDTALLVPGAGGRVDPAQRLRAAALAVVEAAVAGADAVVVVAPGRVTRELSGRVVVSLGAAGIGDEQLGWPAPAVGDGPDVLAGVPASVGLHLLARAGCGGPTRVVEVAPDSVLADLADLGARLVHEAATALVVVGSASGRHGPDAPLADDGRAPAYDEALIADLAEPTRQAQARLADLALQDARDLAVTGWAPWQVLLGSLGTGDGDVVGHLEHAEVLAGAQHAAIGWRAS